MTLKGASQDFYKISNVLFTGEGADKVAMDLYESMISDSDKTAKDTSPTSSGAKSLFTTYKKEHPGTRKTVKDFYEPSSKSMAPKSEDFCKVSPNICKGNLGIPRIKMPQIAEGDLGDFVDYLKEKGVKSQKTVMPVNKLKATQKEINAQKSEAIAESIMKGGLRPGTAVIVSSDGHILDGHHRWAAGLLAMSKGKKVTMDVIKVDMPIKKLLDAAYKYPKTTYAGFNDKKAAELYWGSF